MYIGFDDGVVYFTLREGVGCLVEMVPFATY